MKFIFLVHIFFYFFSTFLFAQSGITEMQKRLKQLNQSIEETNKLLNETQEKETSTTEKLLLAQANIENRQQIIYTLNTIITQLQKQMDSYAIRIKKLSKSIEVSKKNYKEILKLLYRYRNREHLLMHIFASNSFGEAYRKYFYFQKYSDYRLREINKIIQQNRELNFVMKELYSKKREQINTYNKKENEVQQLFLAKEQAEQQISMLKSQQEKLNQEIEEKRQTSETLNKQIHKLIQKQLEQEKKQRSSLPKNQQLKNTEQFNIQNLDFQKNIGKMDWPVVKGVVISNFGVYDHPLNKRIKLHNNGIQILTPNSVDVYVVADGVVSSIINTQSSNTVLVQHGSYFTVYGNLVNLKVKTGDVLKKNDIIGKVAILTAYNKFVLQFELWNETIKINPILWLKK